MNTLIGKRIKEARIAQNVTQRVLADEVEISTSYMNLIESGRRPVAGNLLNKIATFLKTDAASLSQEVSKTTIDQLHSVCLPYGISEEEITQLAQDQSQWVEVVLGLGDQLENLKFQLNAVTDSLSLDHGFSSTVHDLLTRITSIRSTASILNTQGDLAPEKDARFRDILHTDARSASDIARQLVAQFEKSSKQVGAEISALQSFSVIMHRDHYVIPFLEERFGKITQDELSALMLEDFEIDITQAPILSILLHSFAKDISFLPRAKFIGIGKETNWDLEQIALEFSCSYDRILRRIAMVSKEAGLARMSLNIIDQTGQDWLISPVTSSGGFRKLNCALWPIFDQELYLGSYKRAVMSLGQAENFEAMAASGIPDLGRRERSKYRISTMVSYLSPLETQPLATPIIAHLDCRACLKSNCQTRRNRAVFD